MPTKSNLLFLLCAPFVSLQATEPEKPNIVLIFADDVGYGDLDCYGAKLRTPEIDRLASGGFRTTDCLVAANACGPSRASLMTGRYPMRCGHPISRHNTPKYAKYGIAPDELTMPELLKTAGYYNKMVGNAPMGWKAQITKTDRSQTILCETTPPLAN